MILPEEPKRGVRIRPWLKQLYAFVKSLALSGDGKTCRVTRNPAGSTITVLFPDAESAGGGVAARDEYAGFFVLGLEADDDTGKIRLRVYDGTGHLGPNCGLFISGIDRIAVPETMFEEPKAGVVLLEAVFADEQWTVEVKNEAELPELSAEKFTALIGYVERENDEISAVRQVWNNGIIYNNRYA